jgi:hypothetical protein
MSITAPIPVANDANRNEEIIPVSEQLQRQNDRLELLLNLTTKITSSLDLREVLRAIAAQSIFRTARGSSRKSCSLRQALPQKRRWTL